MPRSFQNRKTALTKKKVAIVGFSETTRDLAPFDDQEFEIWGCNHIYQYIPRWDVIFEMHTPAELAVKYAGLGANRWPEYENFLKNSPAPIYMQEAYYEGAVRLPIEELCEHFYVWDEDPETRERKKRATFKSTISYMLAMAIMEGYEEISIYGVDMVLDSEWGYQRHNMAFFMGWARGLGIEISIPGKSALMREGKLRLYGYDHVTDRYAPVIEQLRGRVGKYDAERQRMVAADEQNWDEIERVKGAVRELDGLLADGNMNGHTELLTKRRGDYLEEIKRREVEAQNHVRRMHYIDGKRDEAFNLMDQMGYHNRGELAGGFD